VLSERRRNGTDTRARWRVTRTVVASALALGLALAAAPRDARAGAQLYEPLSDSVRSALAAALLDRSPPEPRYATAMEKADWLAEMGVRLPVRHKPTHRERYEFLQMVRYEAQRAGLDPHLVLGLIQVESGFRRHAISSAGARGYMQVMPFWTRLIGDGDPAGLFDARTNLRYGCVILRHYLDIERGDLFRALGRYNGSLGRSEYPDMVLAAWKRWEYKAVPTVTQVTAQAGAPGPAAAPVSTGLPAAVR
jgi:soluble lytic murein transglycosylase-like protein